MDILKSRNSLSLAQKLNFLNIILETTGISELEDDGRSSEILDPSKVPSKFMCVYDDVNYVNFFSYIQYSIGSGTDSAVDTEPPEIRRASTPSSFCAHKTNPARLWLSEEIL